MECWKDVEIPGNTDYQENWIIISANQQELKRERILLEHCQIFKLTFFK